MKVWAEETLGELCSLITDGKHGDCRNEDNSGYYFISCKDVREGRIHYENSRQIVHGDFAETHRRTDLWPGDVLLTNSGTIGRLAIAPDDEKTQRTTFQKSVAILKPLPERISSHFLYYSLAANRARLINSAGGAAQKNLLLGELRRFTIRVPPLVEQAKIASILSAYDDLIENNRRRIQLLEQAARLLYKEWFVHLRFPGHEHVTITDGVPGGWEKKKIADVCETVGGGTPSTKVSEYWEGDITWMVPSDITKNNCLALLDSERKITEKGLRESSAKMVPAETILMTSRASVGFFALMDLEVCTNQGFINIIPHEDELRMYLLFNLMSRVAEIRSNAKGTTYPEISKGRFRGMDVVVPPNPLVSEFMRFASDIIQQVRYLKRSTLQLKAARDLLLPRLMNGAVTV